MFQCLKKRLRSWLLDEEGLEPPSRRIVVILEGEYQIVEVTGVAGMFLVCHKKEDGCVTLVESDKCQDEKQFWALWNYHTKGKKITWEDGTPYRIPG